MLSAPKALTADGGQNAEDRLLGCLQEKEKHTAQKIIAELTAQRK